ncbi:hypothetical protein SEA_EASTWEST_43 [Arthrobacter phage EastWest]|uniref:Uncharacterized protein n=1 Tax=Arthrobacter phage EastWest TaxID=2894292 RepID=A0AAE8YK51_9CAUD|nr:hypothetical protein SEA_EASTWEST_43 [Arthrobacter phage EastWest]
MSSNEIMTAAEFATASRELRQLQSELVRSELNAVKTQIKKLQTAAGKLEQKRRAAQTAQRYITTARQAADIAALKQLADERNEDEAIGRRRLLEAAAEATTYKSTEVFIEPVTADTLEHGLAAYRRGDCKCDAICRPANAKDARERRHRKQRNDHQATQPTEQTTQSHTPHAPSTDRAPAEAEARQEEVSSSSTRYRAHANRHPLRKAHSRGARRAARTSR